MPISLAERYHYQPLLCRKCMEQYATWLDSRWPWDHEFTLCTDCWDEVHATPEGPSRWSDTYTAAIEAALLKCSDDASDGATVNGEAPSGSPEASGKVL